MDRKAWPALKEKLTKVFKSKSRADWCKIMEGTDICFAPILTMAEAPDASAHGGAQGVRRAPWRDAACARAAILADAVGDPGAGGGEDRGVTSAWKAGR